jgi:amidohydrolase
VGQEGLHQHRGRGRAEADAERAELPLLEQLDAPFQLPRLEEDALGPRRHQLTVGRQRGALAVPVDQPHVQILLEGLDAAAQRRLGEEEGLGGLAEGVVLGQGDEVAQLVEVHVLPLVIEYKKLRIGRICNRFLLFITSRVYCSIDRFDTKPTETTPHETHHARLRPRQLPAGHDRPAQAVEAPLLADIQTRVAAVEGRMIAWRRDIHQHPELSNQEHRTAKLVADHLKKLGLEVKTGVGGTGVVGLLKGDLPGKVVALRADMDALPVKELVDLPFASKAKGKHMGKEVDVMHACGHDGHTAILMATAEVLAGMKSQLRGSVKFIFQPAEEGPPKPPQRGRTHRRAGHGGCRRAREPQGRRRLRPAPDPGLPGGHHRLPLRCHPRLGRHLHGEGQRQADPRRLPWNGIDPIVSTAQIVMGLQTIVSRQMNISKEPVVVSIGSIHGGNRENIIPDSVELLGTVRAFDDRMRDDTLARMRTTAESIAQASGAKAEVKFLKPGYSATVNDESLTARMLPTLQQVTGGKAVVSPKLSASEDFSEFQKKVPGMFFFLGSTDPKRDLKAAAPNHSPKFEIDEASLAVGARAMTALALDYLAQP